jgi:hypothetical protein
MPNTHLSTPLCWHFDPESVPFHLENQVWIAALPLLSTLQRASCGRLPNKPAKQNEVVFKLLVNKMALQRICHLGFGQGKTLKTPSCNDVLDGADLYKK